ncbi:MAG: response regulator [Rhodospirillales bacterium]|jgi:two-component system, cell cycle sensor histidine kinase and response regulator CckA|nr:response regulator [Rhodospirillales bacterium]MBT4039448.1 response regulator [Rhodospirillales bacterium]MBT4626590.1 response regulator [Rhodospirillales bacterium]MBT5352418.1 response regulator [Rhodospirillales bacterium]MBT5520432.1 response regulator [Rhodospirillales bacterium]
MNRAGSTINSILGSRLFWGALGILCGTSAITLFLVADTDLSVGLAGGLLGAAVISTLSCLSKARKGDEKGELSNAISNAIMRGGDAVLITDRTGERIHATAAYDAAFTPASGVSGIREAVIDLEARAEFERVFANASGGVPTRGEVWFSLAGGGQQWWRINAVPDDHDHIVWRLDDISQQREHQRQGREEVNMVNDFLDNLPVGFYATDSDGNITYSNAVFSRWVGRTADDLVQNKVPFEQLLRGDKVPPEGGVGYVTLQTGTEQTFRAYIIQNRRARAQQGGSRAVVLRDPENGSDSNADLTDQSVDNQAAVAAAVPPDWLFDDAPVGIAILDGNGAIRYCNTSLARFLGKSGDALKGISLATFIAPQDEEEYTGVLSKMIMGTARSAHVEVRFPSSDSAVERAASLYVSKMGDNDDMVLHVIDETEHRHLELQFTQSQKMQAVGQLAGGVAHDFNNLLTAMIGFSDLLLERHGPDDESFADIMQIKQNANRATNLVRQLLAFSRKQTLKPVVLDPTEMLGDLSHLLGRLIGERVELTFEHAPDAYLIRADRGQFDQVIINLAVNARDAMPGGGTLSVRTRNETVTAPVQRGPDVMPPGTYVVISVSDTGTGISRENIERIFEPFFSTKEVGAGTGLGLSTVYGIIRQSEGFVFVESALGHGTTFSIYLPASGAEGETGVRAAARGADQALMDHRARQKEDAVGSATTDLTGSGVILLVEDEDAVRLFGSRALRNKGYTVLEADNGETALDVLNGSKEPIDLIVSDVVMPGMDGHTFIQLVRQEMPDMRVVLMSGYTEEVFREEISRDPSIHFLAKPFSLKTLASTVRDVMNDG